MTDQYPRRYVLTEFIGASSTLTQSVVDDGDRAFYTLECDPCFGHSSIGWMLGPEQALALVKGFAAGEVLVTMPGPHFAEYRAHLAAEMGLGEQEPIDAHGEFVEVGCAGGVCSPVIPLTPVYDDGETNGF